MRSRSPALLDQARCAFPSCARREARQESPKYREPFPGRRGRRQSLSDSIRLSRSRRRPNSVQVRPLRNGRRGPGRHPLLPQATRRPEQAPRPVRAGYNNDIRTSSSQISKQGSLTRARMNSRSPITSSRMAAWVSLSKSGSASRQRSSARTSSAGPSFWGRAQRVKSTVPSGLTRASARTESPKTAAISSSGRTYCRKEG